MATSGKHPNMTMFWLKTHGEWKEQSISSDTARIELNYSINVDEVDLKLENYTR